MKNMEYLTVSQAAKKAKTSIKTIYNWIHGGKLRYFNIHEKRGIRIAEPDLDHYMEEYFLVKPKQHIQKLIKI